MTKITLTQYYLLQFALNAHGAADKKAAQTEADQVHFDHTESVLWKQDVLSTQNFISC